MLAVQRTSIKYKG